MKTVRVFVAHSKQDSDEFIERVREKIALTLQNAAVAQGKIVKIDCVLGRDDHAEHFKRAGSWDAWAVDVVDRVNYITREPEYRAIIVTNRFVGKATSQIVQRALAMRRPILLFCDDEILRAITRVDAISGGDFKSGWGVVA